MENLSITALLIVIGLSIIIFFIFRGINLWYWKVNDLIKNQENQENLLAKQNEILKNIYVQLGGKTEKEKKEKNTKTSNTNEVDLGNVNLNEDDENVVKNLIKTIKNDEVIVRVKLNGRIIKWKKEDWNEVIKTGDQDKYELIFSNKN